MRRSLALLLASVLLAFSLTACGKDRQPGDAANGGSVTGDTNTANNGNVGDSANSGVSGSSSDVLTGDPGSGVNGTAGNGAAGGGTEDSVTGGVNGRDGGAMMDGALDTLEHAGDAARNAVEGTGSRMGGTYEQMVRNGQVF